ncbi:MAG: glycoside hydrolase family 38 C-terminal domain-containing protein [bacterium]
MRKIITTTILYSLIIFSAFVMSNVNITAKDGTPKHRSFIIPHFHYDPVWTNSQAGETMRAFSILHQVLEFLPTDERTKFVLCEVDYLKPYWDAYPRNRKPLLDFIAANRIELTGGYSEPDEASVGGEALIRNFIYGKIFKEAAFGTQVEVGAQHDVFGHAVQLPQILLKTGHTAAQFSRGNLTDLPHDFLWLAPDGSSILAKQIGYGGTAATTLLEARDLSLYKLHGNAMFMSGGDFSEPDRTISKFIKKTKSFEVIVGTHRDYFNAVRTAIKERGIVMPEVSRDHTPLLPGCYSSRTDTKLANRWNEITLADAEKFASIATRLGALYPHAALDKAWRLLLFGQHHDALTGSDTENVNLDLLTAWRESLSLASSVRDNALKLITANIDTKSSAPSNAIPVVIFNSLNWDRSEPVNLSIPLTTPANGFNLVDSEGSPVPFQLAWNAGAPPYKRADILFIAAVPSLGYAAYYLVPSDNMPKDVIPKRTDGTTAENDFFTIKVDPARGGGIVSLYGKTEQKEYINPQTGVGNEIFAIKENNAKVEGPWSIHSTGQVWRSSDYPAEKVQVESGPIAARIIVNGAPQTDKVKIYDGNDMLLQTKNEDVLCRRTQEIILYKNLRRIDFRTHLIDFKETDYLYKVGFPASVSGALPVFGERFAAVGRDKNTEKFMFYDFWREPGVKRGREYPAYMWMDFTSPARLEFTDGKGDVKTSFALAIGELVIPDDDAVRSLSNQLARAFARKGVTTTPTDDKKQRTNEYYGFRITLGAENNAYTNKLVESLSSNAHDTLTTQLDKQGYAFLFVQPADSVTATEDRKPIPVLIVEAKDAAKLQEAVSLLTAQLEKDGNIRLVENVNAASITGTIEPFGIALLDRGHTGYSVENNDTLTMTLMRSSTGSPSGRLYSRNLEVENWNHIYEYSLVPHTGDWRSAKIYRTGWEFNHSLYPVTTRQHGGELPAVKSFLSTQGTDAVITALKPAGFPFVASEPDATSTSPDTFAVRFYEPTGFASAGELQFYEPIKSVAQTDMIENPVKSSLPLTQDGFELTLNPFEINTYLINIASEPVKTAVPLAPDSEQFAPVFTRYWETNQNTASMRNQPVTVVIEPGMFSPDNREMKIKVTVASNLMKNDVSGSVRLITPSGVTADEQDINTDALKPGEVREYTVTLSGVDVKKLPDHYISALFHAEDASSEDVLTFSNWKVHEGDPAGAESPEYNDSAWKTLPLARFWSEGFAATAGAVKWYRRRFVIPKGMGDMQMFYERKPGADITVYINGDRVQKSADGYQVSPLIHSGKIRYGEENLIAIRVGGGTAGADDAAMWGTAFLGSETLFNNHVWSTPELEVRIPRGSQGELKVLFRNPYDQPLDGVAVLVSPIETWTEGGPHSLIRTAPLAKSFHADPLAEVPVFFSVDVPADADPGSHIVAVKFIYNNIPAYSAPVDIIVEP